MQIKLTKLNAKIFADLKAIGQEAERLGCEAYLVGGVVRDLVLRRESSDLDIVIAGDAVQFSHALAKDQKAEVTVYPQFGTATVQFLNGAMIDFATAREEHYPHPGALPVVRPGTIKADLFRRDFTINALAVVLNTSRLGELQDFYGGYEDLRKKKIRVLHDQSFIDDPTRILRALRFATRFGFQLESKTLKLLKDAIKKDAPATVKLPRYFAEFRKIFSEPRPGLPLRQLSVLKGLSFISSDFRPDLTILTKIEKTRELLKKDNFYKSRDWTPSLFLGCFAKQTTKQLQNLVSRLPLTREERLNLAMLPQLRGIERQLSAKKLSASQIYEILDPLDLEIIYFIRATTSVKIIGFRIDQFLKKGRLTALMITGEDLKSLGIMPGKEMGALLRILLLKKIDGEIKNHKDEIVMARRLALKIRGVSS